MVELHQKQLRAEGDKIRETERRLVDAEKREQDLLEVLSSLKDEIQFKDEQLDAIQDRLDNVEVLESKLEQAERELERSFLLGSSNNHAIISNREQFGGTGFVHNPASAPTMPFLKKAFFPGPPPGGAGISGEDSASRTPTYEEKFFYLKEKFAELLEEHTNLLKSSTENYGKNYNGPNAPALVPQSLIERGINVNARAQLALHQEELRPITVDRELEDWLLAGRGNSPAARSSRRVENLNSFGVDEKGFFSTSSSDNAIAASASHTTCEPLEDVLTLVGLCESSLLKKAEQGPAGAFNVKLDVPLLASLDYTEIPEQLVDSVLEKLERKFGSNKAAEPSSTTGSGVPLSAFTELSSELFTMSATSSWSSSRAAAPVASSDQIDKVLDRYSEALSGSRGLNQSGLDHSAASAERSLSLFAKVKEMQRRGADKENSVVEVENEGVVTIHRLKQLVIVGQDPTLILKLMQLGAWKNFLQSCLAHQHRLFGNISAGKVEQLEQTIRKETQEHYRELKKQESFFQQALAKAVVTGNNNQQNDSTGPFNYDEDEINNAFATSTTTSPGAAGPANTRISKKNLNPNFKFEKEIEDLQGELLEKEKQLGLFKRNYENQLRILREQNAGLIKKVRSIEQKQLSPNSPYRRLPGQAATTGSPILDKLLQTKKDEVLENDQNGTSINKEQLAPDRFWISDLEQAVTKEIARLHEQINRSWVQASEWRRKCKELEDNVGLPNRIDPMSGTTSPVNIQELAEERQQALLEAMEAAMREEREAILKALKKARSKTGETSKTSHEQEEQARSLNDDDNPYLDRKSATAGGRARSTSIQHKQLGDAAGTTTTPAADDDGAAANYPPRDSFYLDVSEEITRLKTTNAILKAENRVLKHDKKALQLDNAGKVSEAQAMQRRVKELEALYDVPGVRLQSQSARERQSRVGSKSSAGTMSPANLIEERRTSKNKVLNGNKNRPPTEKITNSPSPSERRTVNYRASGAVILEEDEDSPVHAKKILNPEEDRENNVSKRKKLEELQSGDIAEVMQQEKLLFSAKMTAGTNNTKGNQQQKASTTKRLHSSFGQENEFYDDDVNSEDDPDHDGAPAGAGVVLGASERRPRYKGENDENIEEDFEQFLFDDTREKKLSRRSSPHSMASASKIMHESPSEIVMRAELTGKYERRIAILQEQLGTQQRRADRLEKDFRALEDQRGKTSAEHERNMLRAKFTVLGTQLKTVRQQVRQLASDSSELVFGHKIPLGETGNSAGADFSRRAGTRNSSPKNNSSATVASRYSQSLDRRTTGRGTRATYVRDPSSSRTRPFSPSQGRSPATRSPSSRSRWSPSQGVFSPEGGVFQQHPRTATGGGSLSPARLGSKLSTTSFQSGNSAALLSPSTSVTSLTKGTSHEQMLRDIQVALQTIRQCKEELAYWGAGDLMKDKSWKDSVEQKYKEKLQELKFAQEKLEKELKTTAHSRDSLERVNADLKHKNWSLGNDLILMNQKLQALEVKDGKTARQQSPPTTGSARELREKNFEKQVKEEARQEMKKLQERYQLQIKKLEKMLEEAELNHADSRVSFARATTLNKASVSFDSSTFPFQQNSKADVALIEQLRKYEQEIPRLENEIKNLRQEKLEHDRTSVQGKESKKDRESLAITKLNFEVSEKDALVQEKQDKILEQQVEIEKQKAEIQQLKKALLEMEEMCREKDLKIDRLELKEEKMKAELGVVRSSIDDVAADNAAELANLSKKTKELKGVIKGKNATIKKLSELTRMLMNNTDSLEKAKLNLGQLQTPVLDATQDINSSALAGRANEIDVEAMIHQLQDAVTTHFEGHAEIITTTSTGDLGGDGAARTGARTATRAGGGTVNFPADGILRDGSGAAMGSSFAVNLTMSQQMVAELSDTPDEYTADSARMNQRRSIGFASSVDMSREEML
ncbi:unnamed protein product [Amoebophrya sp. A120]|nr:unnamed protein product [Amoebophrya sp. A120]|eukprot:GSA120T00008906001.1